MGGVRVQTGPQAGLGRQCRRWGAGVAVPCSHIVQGRQQVTVTRDGLNARAVALVSCQTSLSFQGNETQ